MEAKTLKVPGATLYYEVDGAGPILLFIPGGTGDAGMYAPLARLMTSRFTTLAYDRRGFSRSPFDDLSRFPEDRLEYDVADAIALIDEVERQIDSGGPAFVFGPGSGAIVALEVLSRHPERVRAMVAHEAPLLGILPDAASVLPFLDEVHAIAEREGVTAAMVKFSQHTGQGESTLPGPGSLAPGGAQALARMAGNQAFFIEYEIRQYAVVTPDYARLQPESSKVMLAGGIESRDTLLYRPSTVLAQRLARRVIDMPGGHIGYVTHAREFALTLDAILPDDGAGSPE
jgi:pimeloyl-ACP methyl ester carboxylesterase